MNQIIWSFFSVCNATWVWKIYQWNCVLRARGYKYIGCVWLGASRREQYIWVRYWCARHTISAPTREFFSCWFYELEVFRYTRLKTKRINMQNYKTRLVRQFIGRFYSCAIFTADEFISWKVVGHHRKTIFFKHLVLVNTQMSTSTKSA